ncbi:alpha-galactosidase [Tessaracoccus lapidicaptus]|uniref:alpha-galactosidase n=1 Tax=Tessaracoccus lapidicaptus TaxID=1427523 RepID=UPI00333EF37C
MTTHPLLTVLRHDGVSVVLAHSNSGLPAVLHWGADLGAPEGLDAAALDSLTGRQSPPGTLDAAWRVPVVPQEADGWAGRPGAVLTRDGGLLYPRWTVTDVALDAAHAATVTAHDEGAGLRLVTRLSVAAGGLVLLDHEIINTDPARALAVTHLEAIMPVPKSADHVTMFGGRWTREKDPTTSRMQAGSIVREARRGRPGHDAPWLTIAGRGTPRNRSGELWAVHVGWSGDVVHRVDRLTEHLTMVGGGELLRPSEVVLEPGESYRTPTSYFAWSDSGLDGLSARFHGWMRSRAEHPQSPRPVVLNTWEAVYFDHSPGKLAELARRAAELGVERFVLDDGWFPARVDDSAGLGDWVVDATRWPEGLEPLSRLVHDLGMQFGLWFEPEMVNLDSDVARSHPDWLLANPASVPSPPGLSWRNQYVLDLAHPEAFEHVHGQMDALVRRLGIDFIKWDHNRDLVEPTHQGRPGTHHQTLATYALMQRLKADHPGLEIESCSSGGARSDLGVLRHTDRVWASDSNDPVERQDIQRWTELVLPPELIGAHVGASPTHSSGRSTDLSYRLATALTGSAGFEWDLLGCTPEDLRTIAGFNELYRRLRAVLHTGVVIHSDLYDPALRARGVVSPDRSHAVWTIASVSSPRQALGERLRLEGLDPARTYRVRVCDELGPVRWGWITPPWLADGAVTATGRLLTEVGLQLPTLWPVQALVLDIEAV